MREAVNEEEEWINDNLDRSKEEYEDRENALMDLIEPIRRAANVFRPGNGKSTSVADSSDEDDDF